MWSPIVEKTQEILKPIKSFYGDSHLFNLPTVQYSHSFEFPSAKVTQKRQQTFSFDKSSIGSIGKVFGLPKGKSTTHHRTFTYTQPSFGSSGSLFDGKLFPNGASTKNTHRTSYYSDLSSGGSGGLDNHKVYDYQNGASTMNIKYEAPSYSTSSTIRGSVGSTGYHSPNSQSTSTIQLQTPSHSKSDNSAQGDFGIKINLSGPYRPKKRATQYGKPLSYKRGFTNGGSSKRHSHKTIKKAGAGSENTKIFGKSKPPSSRKTRTSWKFIRTQVLPSKRSMTTTRTSTIGLKRSMSGKPAKGDDNSKNNKAESESELAKKEDDESSKSLSDEMDGEDDGNEDNSESESTKKDHDDDKSKSGSDEASGEVNENEDNSESESTKEDDGGEKSKTGSDNVKGEEDGK